MSNRLVRMKKVEEGVKQRRLGQLKALHLYTVILRAMQTHTIHTINQQSYQQPLSRVSLEEIPISCVDVTS